MPQMSPMWWSLLFILFLLSYVTMMMNIYFFKEMKKKMNGKGKLPLKDLNWKW
uniref:ATP synthase F0 subunit 8 n=1 Tax=Nesidiocoris poppiusi TaxID=3059073 RepID=A0AAT9VWH1_9HEMI|nr:ATP synthase F0 subunit 8 [Nesidiocoris poppiusi]WKW91650.1 ATP synthase F0 subunit 8 [Nesidiocoris poppiusi]